MSDLRPLLLAISSAVLASGVTWLIVRPPPPGVDPSLAARPAAGSSRMIDPPLLVRPSGIQEDAAKTPDRWKDHRGSNGLITAEAMPDAVAAMTIEYSSAPRSSSTFTNWATVERFWPMAT